MKDNLKFWIESPLFVAAVQTACQSFSHGAKLLANVGIDVQPEMKRVFERITDILNEAAYEQLDVMHLLTEAQQLGDIKVEEKKEGQKKSTAGREEDSDSGKRDIGKSD